MHVSVIIPVYNAEKYIATAIDSALAEGEVAEVFVIEDGSLDGAQGICEEYARLPGPQRLRRYLAQSVFLLSHPRIAIHLLTLD